jgi:hypothetical protein
MFIDNKNHVDAKVSSNALSTVRLKPYLSVASPIIASDIRITDDVIDSTMIRDSSTVSDLILPRTLPSIFEPIQQEARNIDYV